MKNIDKGTGYLIVILFWVIVITINGHKKCCIKTAQEVYEYEGWVIKE